MSCVLCASFIERVLSIIVVESYDISPGGKLMSGVRLAGSNVIMARPNYFLLQYWPAELHEMGMLGTETAVVEVV